MKTVAPLVRALITLFAGAFTAAVCAQDQAAPELVDEKPVFREGEVKWPNHAMAVSASAYCPRHLDLWAMRLSPSGKYLLYPHPNDEDLVVRRLRTGKEMVVRVRTSDPWFLRLQVRRRNAFDPSGTKLVLVDERRGLIPMMTVVRFDIPSGKLTRTAISSPGVFARFDRTGRGLFVMKSTLTGLAVYQAASPELKLEPIEAPGGVVSVCPTDDVVGFWVRARTGRRGLFGGRQPVPRQPERLFLYDLKTAKELADLPISDGDANDREPQWTADGRYLGYYDLISAAARSEDKKVERPVDDLRTAKQWKPPVAVTRVWDRVAGKLVAGIPNTTPLGPGPTATTLTLVRRDAKGFGRFVLFDAKTGATHELGGPRIWPVHAYGDRVVYGRSAEKDKGANPGKAAAYTAKIEWPRKRTG